MRHPYAVFLCDVFMRYPRAFASVDFENKATWDSRVEKRATGGILHCLPVSRSLLRLRFQLAFVWSDTRRRSEHFYVNRGRGGGIEKFENASIVS